MSKPDNAGADGEDGSPAAGIISQYVKDLAVENPNAPDSFQWEEEPQIDVQINIAARQIADEVGEVELKIDVNAETERGAIYAISLSYCGLIGMRNLDEGQAHAFIYAEVPRILFPFARRIIADAVSDAGYPPLMLEPVDFSELYIQRMEAAEGNA